MAPVFAGKANFKHMIATQPTNIRSQVRRKIALARFPTFKRARVEDIVVGAIVNYRLYKNRAKSSKVTAVAIGNPQVPQKRGPKDKSLMRNYLLAQLHYAWIVGFDDYPVINNKTYLDSRFVEFAESILLSEGIFRVIGNLEAFRSYRARALLGSGFKVVRGKLK